MKRFYSDVAVIEQAHGFAIALDGRPVKTPAKAALAVPTANLADAIAIEWQAQGEKIDPRTMPLTGLANAAIDRVLPDPAGFADPLAAYAETDLLCYRAGPDQAELAARQEEEWGPHLAWAQQRYDVSFTVTSGIIHTAQPPETVARLADALRAQPAFALVALSPIITITGSLVLSLAVADGVIDGEHAFVTAHLDELWQAEQWGEDDFALATREAHRQDMLAACTLLELVASSRMR